MVLTLTIICEEDFYLCFIVVANEIQKNHSEALLNGLQQLVVSGLQRYMYSLSGFHWPTQL